jgi:hypothetical protein
MLTAALSGCSQAELNMVNISKTVGAWDTYTYTGTVDVNINKDGFTKVAEKTNAEIDADALAELPDKISVDCDGSVNTKDSEYDLNITLNIDENSYPMELIAVGNKMAISAETVYSVISFVQDYDIAYIDEAKLEYVKEITADGYVIFEGDDDNNQLASQFNIAQNIEEGLQSAFSGYSTSLITSKSKNEVELNIGVDAVEKDLIDLLNYTADNRDEISAAVNNMIENIVGAYEDDIEQIEGSYAEDEAVDSFDDVIPSQEDIRDMIADIKESIDTPDYKAYKDMFKDSYIKSTMKLKSDTEYEGTFNLVLKAEDNELLTVKATGNEVKKAVAPIELKGTVVTEDSYKKWFFNKYPVSEVAVDWLADQYDNVTLTSYSGENYYVDYIPMTMIDERIYVPMRAISEALGYEVVWDEENRKAYAVTESGEYVDMTGIIIDDTTFIKVRDFEKLGLTVGYEEDEQFRTATVSK